MQTIIITMTVFFTMNIAIITLIIVTKTIILSHGHYHHYQRCDSHRFPSLLYPLALTNSLLPIQRCLQLWLLQPSYYHGFNNHHQYDCLLSSSPPESSLPNYYSLYYLNYHHQNTYVLSFFNIILIMNQQEYSLFL